MKICLIAAMSENRVIGVGNRLPWRLPDDLKRFKRLTWGHALIVGRKTFESIGGALPGRRMIVMTRQSDGGFPEGVLAARDWKQALQLAGDDSRVFVGGGSEIYRVALPAAHRLYLTLVRAEVEGDRFFPEIDWSEWKLIRTREHPVDSKHKLPFSFQVFDRRQPLLTRARLQD